MEMEIPLNIIMENLQLFTHHPVEVLQLKILAFHHHIIIRVTCILLVISQVMSVAFNHLQTITTISHLHIRCKIIIILITMILSCRTAACIRTLVHHTTRIIILIQHHRQQAFHPHRRHHHRRQALTIINGIISNLSLIK